MNAGQVANGVADMAHAAAGAGAPLRSITMEQVGVLDQLVSHLPAAEQLAIGRQLLAKAEVNSDPVVRGPLAAIINGLNPVAPENPAMTTMLGDLRASIQLEIGRIDGTVPNDGLAGHPKYENLGSIEAKLNFLATVGVI